VLGGVGFACGFFEPIALNPDANQGPLLDLFITGPGGALLGLALGAIVAALKLAPALRRRLLASIALVWGAGAAQRRRATISSSRAVPSTTRPMHRRRARGRPTACRAIWVS